MNESTHFYAMGLTSIISMHVLDGGSFLYVCYVPSSTGGKYIETSNDKMPFQ